MIRSWTVRPDEELYLTNGETIFQVSDEARDAALIEAGRITKRLGGYLATAEQRTPTEVPGEMVTTLLIVTWRDRTDAKAQPEAVPEPIPGQTALPVEPPTEVLEPDGFDYAALAAEDVEESAPAR